MKNISIIAIFISAITSAAVSSGGFCDSFSGSAKDACEKQAAAGNEYMNKIKACESKCSNMDCKVKCSTDAVSDLMDSPSIQEQSKCYNSCKQGDTACISKCSGGMVQKEDLDKSLECSKGCNNDISCLSKCSLGTSGQTTKDTTVKSGNSSDSGKTSTSGSSEDSSKLPTSGDPSKPKAGSNSFINTASPLVLLTAGALLFN
ncbi:hypothetical protein K502DRAFT_350962 [Neoconidiobolus thromboides FSU 785]|nr:hypothetical protein K502DRAFT_350962 [Neoconidiobolus thromboides FSU 785]